MIVADTSALISLASINLLDTLVTEFEVHTTELVVEELEETAEYDDKHGEAAQTVLNNLNQMSIHQVDGGVTSSRVDAGEGSCAILTRETEADFLITDDLRALPELQTIAEAQVAISPIVLKALVQRDTLEEEVALSKLNRLAEQRSWLGAPIYRRAKDLFDTDR
jgi:predicted nucleic acid-binding protein